MSKKVKVAIIGALAIVIGSLIEASKQDTNTIIIQGETPAPIAEAPQETDYWSDEPDGDDEDTETEEDKTEEDKTEELDNLGKGDKIDIREITPIIGQDQDFWYDTPDSKDNMGNSDYTMYIDVYSGLDGREITYPLDYKFSQITGDLALDYFDNDIDYKVWIEFYSGKKKIGATEQLTAGVRPIKFKVDVSKVKNLKMITKSSGNYSTTLLTNGFYLVK